MEEKTERNTQIFFEKYGYMNEKEARRKKPTAEPLSFRQLSIKYNLSVTFLQEVVKRMKGRFEKTDKKLKVKK